MNLFFDTSALVKYFHTEAGTAQVVSLIEDNWVFVVADGILADTVASENLATIRIAC